MNQLTAQQGIEIGFVCWPLCLNISRQHHTVIEAVLKMPASLCAISLIWGRGLLFIAPSVLFPSPAHPSWPDLDRSLFQTLHSFHPRPCYEHLYEQMKGIKTLQL